MKNLYLLLLALCGAFAGVAQTTQLNSASFNYPDAFYFVKEIPLNGLTERPFHIEIMVKENPADSLSRPRIYAVQVRKGKEDIIGNSMVYAKAINGEWTVYSIDGISRKDATRIWFYGAVNGNGNFYFDNLQYSIADNTGTLQEKDLSNPSFEDKKILNGYLVSAAPSKNLQITPSPVAAEGKQSLLVSVSGQKPAGGRSIVRN